MLLFPFRGVTVFCQFVTGCFGQICFSDWPVCWVLFGEFDPGSGRTLAACLTHASRTERPFRGCSSGERVSNTWVICPALWDKPGKLGLIPDRTTACMGCGGKLLRCGMGPRPISLLVGGWPTKATTGSRPERGSGHTGTEIRPRLLREAAVGNIAQWAQA